jgi:NDP-sugar pyrophosphorylase family protein
VISESIILTDCVIGADAVVEHSIIDKRAVIGENARIGKALSQTDPTVTMIGKNAEIPGGQTIEPGAIIGTDVIYDDFSSNLVRGDEYIQTKRLPNEF